MADEVVFSAVLIRGGDTLHLQFDTDVRHTTGDIRSTHADDRSEAGNGSEVEPAVNAHRSAITSGCSG